MSIIHKHNSVMTTTTSTSMMNEEDDSDDDLDLFGPSGLSQSSHAGSNNSTTEESGDAVVTTATTTTTTTAAAAAAADTESTKEETKDEAGKQRLWKRARNIIDMISIPMEITSPNQLYWLRISSRNRCRSSSSRSRSKRRKSTKPPTTTTTTTTTTQWCPVRVGSKDMILNLAVSQDYDETKKVAIEHVSLLKATTGKRNVVNKNQLIPYHGNKKKRNIHYNNENDENENDENENVDHENDRGWDETCMTTYLHMIRHKAKRTNQNKQQQQQQNDDDERNANDMEDIDFTLWKEQLYLEKIMMVAKEREQQTKIQTQIQTQLKLNDTMEEQQQQVQKWSDIETSIIDAAAAAAKTETETAEQKVGSNNNNNNNVATATTTTATAPLVSTSSLSFMTENQYRIEPLRAGDIIEYTQPMFRQGDRRGLQKTMVLAVIPQALERNRKRKNTTTLTHSSTTAVLELLNREVLPQQHFIRRIGSMNTRKSKQQQQRGGGGGGRGGGRCQKGKHNNSPNTNKQQQQYTYVSNENPVYRPIQSYRLNKSQIDDVYRKQLEQERMNPITEIMERNMKTFVKNVTEDHLVSFLDFMLPNNNNNNNNNNDVDDNNDAAVKQQNKKTKRSKKNNVDNADEDNDEKKMAATAAMNKKRKREPKSNEGIKQQTSTLSTTTNTIMSTTTPTTKKEKDDAVIVRLQEMIGKLQSQRNHLSSLVGRQKSSSMHMKEDMLMIAIQVLERISQQHQCNLNHKNNDEKHNHKNESMIVSNLIQKLATSLDNDDDDDENDDNGVSERALIYFLHGDKNKHVRVAQHEKISIALKKWLLQSQIKNKSVINDDNNNHEEEEKDPTVLQVTTKRVSINDVGDMAPKKSKTLGKGLEAKANVSKEKTECVPNDEDDDNDDHNKKQHQHFERGFSMTRVFNKEKIGLQEKTPREQIMKQHVDRTNRSFLNGHNKRKYQSTLVEDIVNQQHLPPPLPPLSSAKKKNSKGIEGIVEKLREQVKKLRSLTGRRKSYSMHMTEDMLEVAIQVHERVSSSLSSLKEMNKSNNNNNNSSGTMSMTLCNILKLAGLDDVSESSLMYFLHGDTDKHVRVALHEEIAVALKKWLLQSEASNQDTTECDHHEGEEQHPPGALKAMTESVPTDTNDISLKDVTPLGKLVDAESNGLTDIAERVPDETDRDMNVHQDHKHEFTKPLVLGEVGIGFDEQLPLEEMTL